MTALRSAKLLTERRASTFADRVVGAFILTTFIVAVSRMVGASAPSLMRYLADDSFYYFSLARHFPPAIADITTTGFHPLYWLVITPIHRSLEGIAAVRATMILIALLHVTSAWLLYRLVSRSRDPAVGCVVSILWLVSVEVRSVLFLGAESAILALTLICFLTLVSRELSAPKDGLLVGGAAALVYLARTDAAIPVGVILLVTFVSRRHHVSLKTVTTCVASFAVLAGPWIVFLATRGSLLQSDAVRALRLMRGYNKPSLAGAQEMTAFVIHHASWIALPRNFRFEGRVAFLATAGLIATAVCMIGLRVKTRDWPPWEVGLAIGTIVVYAGHAAVLGRAREWYAIYAILFVLVVLLPPLVAAFQRIRHRVALWALATSMLVLSLLYLAIPSFFFHPQERDKYLSALAASRTLGSSTAASFNSGIYGYFLPDQVLNVDGVVNPTVIDALTTSRLCSYLRSRHIRYYIDEQEDLPRLEKLAKGVVVKDLVDLSASYRDAYLVVEPQILAEIDTSACA